MPERVDDSSIPDDERLWRRIIPQWLCRDDAGNWRPSSAAFKDSLSREVSVLIAALTTQEAALRDRPADSLAEITAAVPRSRGYKVARDPEGGDTPDDPAHAVLCPPAGRGKNQTRRDALAMAAAAQWIVLREPPA